MVKKFFHIILAVSLLLSCGGFLTNSHYCKSELVKSSIFVILESCCASENSSCTHEEIICGNENQENKCCHNQSEFHKLDQDQILIQSELVSFEQYELCESIVPNGTYQFNRSDQNHQNYSHYIPPPIVFDYQARLQIFLC